MDLATFKAVVPPPIIIIFLALAVSFPKTDNTLSVFKDSAIIYMLSPLCI